MSVLDSTKLLLKKKIEMTKANLKFRLNAAWEKLFFSIPPKIELIKMAAMIALNLIIKQLLSGGYSKEDTKNFLRKDNRAKAILKFTSTDINNDNLSEILLACYGEVPIENIPIIDEELDANDILKTISELNDIDKKTSSIKTKQLVDKIKGTIDSANALKGKIKDQIDQINKVSGEINNAITQAAAAYDMLLAGPDMIKAQIEAEKEKLKQEIENVKSKIQTYRFMLQYIIDQIKILFTKTEHPSKYRTKYLQKLIRNLYALMNEEYEQIKDKVGKEFEAIKSIYESFKAALKSIDTILIAVALMTSIYLINRMKLAKKSAETLKEIVADTTCQTISLEPSDVSINKTPFQITLTCPVITDDVIVPHTPISEKLKNLSCEVTQNEENINDAAAREDLATIAIIKNNKINDRLKTMLTKDSFVNQKTRIASINKQTIFSPVEGYIDKINKDEIIIRDIIDPEEDYLTSQISLLNEKYEKLNNTQTFLKNYYISSLYPFLLATSINNDSSTFNIVPIVPPIIGIESIYKNLKDDFSKINDEYEQQIKIITGKENVEQNANNETLYKIKDELDKLNELFYKNINLLTENAINKSKIATAKPNEFELFEFYSLDLGATFNGLNNPNKIEIEFRDIINEYIRKRYVIDGYQKNKLKIKINDVIQSIEKGNSSGDWFTIALNAYNQKKSLIDLKDWLTKLANENSDLENTEKIVRVNRVMFLFDLYLNTDQITQKYNLLKKETTPRKEVIKEGNNISKFMSDLWKDYEKIPKELKQIEKTIDSLSLFTTYSITQYEGKQARLYSLADEPKCKPKETDPYLNPKSQYGYKDIQYWLKYCSFATLASVTNPATGWSTGWITPSPIMFPVIYIPIKSIMTKSGFTVIGLSICGIYVFPWVLFANLSISYTTPFGDPTAALKKEIQALKKEISEQMVNLKKVTLKPILDSAKKDVDQTLKELTTFKKQLKKYRSEKPKRNTDLSAFKNAISEIGKKEETVPTEEKISSEENLKNKMEYAKDKVDDVKGAVDAAKALIEQNLAYLKAMEEWIKNMAETAELIATTQIKLWKNQIKYALIYDAINYGKSLKGVTDALEQIEKFMNDQLDKLEMAVENVGKILAALPISLAPETVNFGITLKNTKPIINISDELDDNINTEILDKIIEKFKLKNLDFLSSNYGSKISASILNMGMYKSTLSTAMMLIMKRDAFPKYENLKITNVPWIMFLYKDFVTEGAKTFGFPGQNPMPI